jgi:hypothetical protein
MFYGDWFERDRSAGLSVGDGIFGEGESGNGSGAVRPHSSVEGPCREWTDVRIGRGVREWSGDGSLAGNRARGKDSAF